MNTQIYEYTNAITKYLSEDAFEAYSWLLVSLSQLGQKVHL